MINETLFLISDHVDRLGDRLLPILFTRLPKVENIFFCIYFDFDFKLVF